MSLALKRENTKKVLTQFDASIRGINDYKNNVEFDFVMKAEKNRYAFYFLLAKQWSN